jgi:hypothetical protein
MESTHLSKLASMDWPASNSGNPSKLTDLFKDICSAFFQKTVPISTMAPENKPFSV